MKDFFEHVKRLWFIILMGALLLALFIILKLS